MSNSDETPIVVRAATENDLDSLDAFIQPFVAQNLLLPRTMEELIDLLKHGFVATNAEGSLVGFAALEVYSRKLAEVRSLAVLDAYRRFGVGRRLVSACIERARDLNVLEVMAITANEDFFRACGFDFTLPGQKKALFMQTREDPN